MRYAHAFKHIDFHCGPAEFKPVIRRIKAQSDEQNAAWEIDFDLSNVQRGRVIDLTIEADLRDVAAPLGITERWLRYKPQFETDHASIWLLFPESRPYSNFSLQAYPSEHPEEAKSLDTQYVINHPKGSILAWAMTNPEVGYVYVCQWDWTDSFSEN